MSLNLTKSPGKYTALEQKETWLNNIPVENNIFFAVETMKYCISYKCQTLSLIINIINLISLLKTIVPVITTKLMSPTLIRADKNLKQSWTGSDL